MGSEPRFTESSGNVFADLGLADAGIRLAKAELARSITAIIQERGLTQREAARTLGVDQPKVSAITRGRLRDFSLDRLLALVNRMGMDIEIKVVPNPELTRPSHLRTIPRLSRGSSSELGTSEFLIDLPYALTLQESYFPMLVRGETVNIRHEIVEHEQYDERLGGQTGRFGLQRDPSGLLRYSRLRFAASADDIQRLERAFFADLLQQRGVAPTAVRAHVAVAVCNHFLDVYRASTFDHRIEPIGMGSLARVRYRSEKHIDDNSLYGGGWTLPRVGLVDDALTAFMAESAAGMQVPTYRLTILDALRAVERGGSNGALVAALGALESALDAYFAARWRGATLQSTIAGAVAEVDPRRKKGLYTLDDVLKAANLQPKLVRFCTLESVDPWEQEGIMNAIEVRNDAVHGGVAIPASLARTHITAVGDFLENQTGPTTKALPKSPNPRLLDAFTEATGTPPPLALQTIARRYLVDQQLDAVMYSVDLKTSKRPISDYYGRSMVARIPFDDPAYKDPAHAALTVARMVVFFSLTAVGMTPRARVGDLAGPLQGRRAAYELVASELTRAVWETAVDRLLAAEGLTAAIDADITNRAQQLRKVFKVPYAAPPTLSPAGFLQHVELARVAAALDSNKRERLLQTVSKASPNVAARARKALPALLAAELGDPITLRSALVDLHDASDKLWGSVAAFDPSTGLLYGAGLTPNPQPAA
jgi:predicted XRE-type DNA-binding protein